MQATHTKNPFDLLGLDPVLLRAVYGLGYEAPTPIQKEAIPAILSGRDVIGTAQTGSGKTAAFLLPILHRLLKQSPGHTRALVLSPTRELAAQIEVALRGLAKGTKIRGHAVYGGVGMAAQEHALRSGVDVVVATPGRLLDHMSRRNVDFRGLQVLVLDEADRMLDMGFLPDVRRIVDALPRERQTLLFSATMAPEIETLSRTIMRNPVRISVSPPHRPPSTIRHEVYPVAQHLKTSLLVRLLGREDMLSVLVFVRTKRRADRVARQVGQAGFDVARIHGDRSQSQRETALAGFRSGRHQVLIATDVAARGIDVEGISHVINYDVPTVPTDYVHRVGRTARMEAAGEAITFVTPEDEGDVRAIERALGKPIPRVTLPDFDYRAPPPPKVPGHGGARPVVGPFERYGGRTIVQSRPLEATSCSIRAKSAYGFRRIQRTKLIKIQGRRPSMAETLTVTMRRTPASRMAVSSARATSLTTVVGPRPSGATIEITASCPRTARRMSSRFRPSPWTTPRSPWMSASASGRRVNAVIACCRRMPSSITSRPVRPLDPITAMFMSCLLS